MNISEYEMEANQKDKAVMTLPSSSAIQFLFFFLLRSGRGRKRKRVRVREGHYSTPPSHHFLEMNARPGVMYGIRSSM